MIYHIFKRLIDILVALFGLVLISPLFILIAILVKSTSKGSIVYSHERIGKDGKVFYIHKFRTMVYNARDLQKKGVKDSELITSIGWFLRKTFLDETLQLWDVFVGNMSLIGPRPIDRKSTRLNSSHIPLSRMPSSA